MLERRSDRRADPREQFDIKPTTSGLAEHRGRRITNIRRRRQEFTLADAIIETARCRRGSSVRNSRTRVGRQEVRTVPLSEDEERILSEIEQGLYTEDPASCV